MSELSELQPEFTIHTFLVAVIAGGLAGMAADFIVFPIDKVKTRLQANKGAISEKQSGGMFQGLASAMLAAFPCTALFWIAYEYSKFYLAANHNESLDIGTQNLIAASIGGLFEALARCPFEVVKLKLQMGKYKGSWEAVSDIWY